MHRLFVYGTLLPGESNHGLLRTARLLGAARTLPRFELRNLGGFPALLRHGTRSIEGEVVEVDDETLHALDRLEGHPDYYRRERIELHDGSSAEVYLLSASQARGCPVIASGSWRQHRASLPRTHQLAALVDELYCGFAPYSPPPTPRVCPCCVDASDHRLLTSSPLRALTAAQLAPFARKAMTTWGDDQEFRHYLPRLLELLAPGQAWHALSGEILLGKLAHARWRDWPAHESDLIERFFRLLWSLSLDDPTSLQLPAPDLLCGLSAVFDDLAPFLKAWDAHPSDKATAQLRTMNERWGEAIRTGDLERLPFWRPSGVAQVAAWLSSPAVQARLTQAGA